MNTRFLIKQIFLFAANCNPVDKNKDDEEYLNDDDYQEDPKDDSQVYDDDEFEDDNKKASSTASPPESEKYITQEKVEVVDVGKSITIQCIGDNLDDSTLYLWFKDQAILFQGPISKPISITKDPRIAMSPKDGSLTIINVEITDDSEYRCRTYPKGGRYEVKIKVMVNGPPANITIGHNQATDKSDIANTKISYKVGEKDLRFKCNPGKSHPKATVSWNHNGNVVHESNDNDVKIIDESILVFRSLHARHSGKYECVATNEFGNIKAAFELDVQCKSRYNFNCNFNDIFLSLIDMPFFKLHHNYFNTEADKDAEIFCLYRSSPAAKSVKWFKGTTLIRDGDKYQVTADEKDHHDRTILLIKNVAKSDLTSYNCEVQVGSSLTLLSLKLIFNF